jgi:hypothetical protein
MFITFWNMLSTKFTLLDLKRIGLSVNFVHNISQHVRNIHCKSSMTGFFVGIMMTSSLKSWHDA